MIAVYVSRSSFSKVVNGSVIITREAVILQLYHKAGGDDRITRSLVGGSIKRVPSICAPRVKVTGNTILILNRVVVKDSLYLMSGGYDLAVLLHGKTMREVAVFVAQKLATLEAVTSTATHFVLRKYKDHGVVFGAAEIDERGNIL